MNPCPCLLSFSSISTTQAHKQAAVLRKSTLLGLQLFRIMGRPSANGRVPAHRPGLQDCKVLWVLKHSSYVRKNADARSVLCIWMCRPRLSWQGMCLIQQLDNGDGL